MPTIENRAQRLEEVLERVEGLADIHEIREADFIFLQNLWPDRNADDIAALFPRFLAIWPKFPEFCRPRSYTILAVA